LLCARSARLRARLAHNKTLEAHVALSALPYTDEEMEPVEYKIDLPTSKNTVLIISHKTLGVGTYGCGPIPLEQYRVYGKRTKFNYVISL